MVALGVEWAFTVCQALVLFIPHDNPVTAVFEWRHSLRKQKKRVQVTELVSGTAGTQAWSPTPTVNPTLHCL